jgi:hypothetical protein
LSNIDLLIVQFATDVGRGQKLDTLGAIRVTPQFTRYRHVGNFDISDDLGVFAQNEGAIILAGRRDITLYLTIDSQPTMKSGVASDYGLRTKDVDGTARFSIRLLNTHERDPLLNSLPRLSLPPLQHFPVDTILSVTLELGGVDV